jgi:hypothetical protein
LLLNQGVTPDKLLGYRQKLYSNDALYKIPFFIFDSEARAFRMYHSFAHRCCLMKTVHDSVSAITELVQGVRPEHYEILHVSYEEDDNFMDYVSGNFENIMNFFPTITRK